ncbi:MAG: hypothetical protein AB7V50_03140 [Vampirovibrionia bacterium]
MDKLFNNLIEGQQEQIMTEQENRKDMWMQEVSKQIFSKDNIEVKTDLNTNQINALTRGILYADTFNVSIMKNLCNTMMILSVSKNRLGRKEFTEIAKTFQNESELDYKPSLKERLGF